MRWQGSWQSPCCHISKLIDLRLIATDQMTWFTLNVIAKPTQKLVVSTLELTTVAFVFYTLGTCYCCEYSW